MTGYGKASGVFKNNQITIEIKSLNSKNLELNLRLPHSYREKELEFRNEIAKHTERGKIDVVVSIDNKHNGENGILNTELIKRYASEITKLENSLKIKTGDMLGTIMRMPNIFVPERMDASPEEWKFTEKLFLKAAKSFNDFRLREGKVLNNDFEKRINTIRRNLKKIEKAEPGRHKAIKQKLRKGLEEISSTVNADYNRFEQELIYYIEKLDITEEKVRLNTHLDYFLETLNDKDSNGKKIGFILQEIGREINTIGSKANDAMIQRLVVEMKDELEKMKEQSANIL